MHIPFQCWDVMRRKAAWTKTKGTKEYFQEKTGNPHVAIPKQYSTQTLLMTNGPCFSEYSTFLTHKLSMPNRYFQVALLRQLTPLYLLRE